MEPLVQDDFDEENNTRQEPTSPRRSNWVVGSIVVATLGIVGMIVALTVRSVPATSNNAGSSSGLNTQGIPSQKLEFAPCHPTLCGVTASPQAGSDASVDRYTAHTEITTGPDGHYTKFHYDAEVVKDVHRLDLDTSIEGMVCNDTALRVRFTTAADALNFSTTVKVNSTLMPILREWGCGAHVRRVGHNVTVVGTVATVHTTNASFAAMFKSCNITFNGTLVPGQKFVSVPKSVVDSKVDGNKGQGNRNRKDFVSDLESMWDDAQSDISTALADVNTISNDLNTLSNILASGNFSYDDQPWSKNIQKSQSCGNNEIGDLTTCSYNINAQLTFQIQIVDYELQLLEIEMSGATSAGIATNGQAITKSWNGEVSIPGFDTTLWATVLAIGPIPIPLSLHGSMTNEFNWDVTGTLNMNGNIGVSGDLTIGAKYTPETDLVPIVTHSLKGQAVINYATGSLAASGTITSTTQLTFSAMLAADLSANLVVTPTVSATGTETVEGAGISFSDGAAGFDVTQVTPSSPSYDSPCHPQAETDPTNEVESHVDNPSLAIAVAVGVDLSTAIKIDIEIDSYTLLDKSWPLPGYNNLFQLGKWCIIPKLN